MKTVERQGWQQEDRITVIVQEKEDCFPKQFDVGKNVLNKGRMFHLLKVSVKQFI